MVMGQRQSRQSRMSRALAARRQSRRGGFRGDAAASQAATNLLGRATAPPQGQPSAMAPETIIPTVPEEEQGGAGIIASLFKTIAGVVDLPYEIGYAAGGGVKSLMGKAPETEAEKQEAFERK